MGSCWDGWQSSGLCQPQHKEPPGWEVSRHQGAAGWPGVQDQSRQGLRARQEVRHCGTVTGRGQQGGDGWSEHLAECGIPSL